MRKTLLRKYNINTTTLSLNVESEMICLSVPKPVHSITTLYFIKD